MWETSVVNHHWGCGVVFFLLHQIGGLDALTLFSMIFNLAALMLILTYAARNGNFWIALAAAFLLLPFLAARQQPRPEIFSILFFVVNIIVLHGWYNGKIDRRYLWVLPFIQLLWVNIHILFYFGVFLQGAIWLQLLINGEKRTNLPFFSLIFLTGLLASLVNPAFFEGVIYPFRIMGEIQYDVTENLSLSRIRAEMGSNISFYHIELTFLLAALYLYYWVKNPRKAGAYLYLILWLVTFGALFLWRIRANVFFGYVLLLVTIHLTSTITSKQIKIASRAGLIAAILFAVIAANLPGSPWNPYPSEYVKAGLGVDKKMDGGAAYFLRNNLKGPIFNNFDIGDYLIYHLYPDEKVFVDSRPEAYPPGFFAEKLVPVFTNQLKWLELDHAYKFNVVFLGYHSQVLNLVERLFFDDGWFMAYNDDYTIIFIKRGPKNDHLVRKTLLEYKSLNEIQEVFRRNYDMMMRERI